MTIYEYDVTGHISYLEFSPVKNTVKSFKLAPADEFKFVKSTVDGHVEYKISKYE